MSVLSELHAYIRGAEFKQQLVRDYKRLEIMAEGGLRNAVCRLLRRRLRSVGGPAQQYQVIAEARLYLCNVIPDVSVWKSGKPRFVIECKDTSRFDAQTADKDWEKLKNISSKYPSVKRGYLIYVARKRDEEFRLTECVGKCRMTLIKIILSDRISNFHEWEAKYLERLRYVPKVKAKAASAH
jgi:hypothetical protein